MVRGQKRGQEETRKIQELNLCLRAATAGAASLQLHCCSPSLHPLKQHLRAVWCKYCSLHSNRWLMPTGAIVLQRQSPIRCQGPPRDSSLAREIETLLKMLDSLDILVMTFPTIYPLVYFEAWQCPPEVPAKQMFRGMTCFHTETVNIAIYFWVLGFGLRFPSSVLLVYSVPAQKCLLLRKAGCEVLLSLLY